LDSTITRKYGGTGLGLVISKQLCEIMGGTIWVNSTFGGGSTFNFTVKFKKGANTSLKKKKENIIIKDVRLLYILLVEDDDVNQRVLAKMLKGKGHTVDVASNGLEALEKYEIGKYDIIFMDILMPHMGGVEALKHIREIEGSGMHTPVIAITANALKGDRERFLAMGMDEYISKPVQMKTLFEVIDKTLEKSAQEHFSVELDNNGDINLFSPTRHEEILDYKKKILIVFNDLLNLTDAVNSGVFIDIEKTSHLVKTSAGEINSELIKNLAFKIELAARRASIDDIKKYYSLLKKEFLILNKNK